MPLEIAQRDHWLAFLPWPQTLRGEVQLARNDPEGAEGLLRQAFARACQLGDPAGKGCKRARDTAQWVATMRHLASRTGMKELTVRALLHSAAVGHDGDGSAAALLAADIANPAVHLLV